MDGNYTYCANHFAVHTNSESLPCTPENNMLCINYISRGKGMIDRLAIN